MYFAYFRNTETNELFRSNDPKDNPKGKHWVQITYENYLECSHYQAVEQSATLATHNKELMSKLENGIELVKQGTYSSGALQLWAKTAKDLLAKVKQKGG